jgi:hypothetical protein
MNSTPYQPSTNEEDKLLKELFAGYRPDQADASLKQTVMSEILHDWAQQPAQSSSKSVFRYWWIIPAAMILAVAIYYIDFSQYTNKSGTMGLEMSTQPLQNVALNMKQVSRWLSTIPMVVWFTTGAALLLLSIDQMINKLKQA